MSIDLDRDARRYLLWRQAESSSLGAPEMLRAQERSLRSRYGHGPQLHSEVEVPVSKGLPRHFILNPSARPAGTVIYFHGGGWVISEPEDYLAVCRALAAESGWRVVIGDYRKAPENPFPAAYIDAYNLVRQFVEDRDSHSAEQWGPLVVMGDSAGGNLAAAVTAQLSVEAPHALAAQVLITPVLDTDLHTESYLDPSRQLSLTRETMRWFLDQYVSSAQRADPRVAPLRSGQKETLPLTIFVSVHSDVLHSEGETYVCQLQEAGVVVEHLEFSGQMHGFFQLYNVMKASKKAVAWVSRSLRDLAERAVADQQKKGVAQ